MSLLHPGESHSFWLDDIEMPKYSSLKKDIETDVCIVGGGIAGLTTAYLLMKEGQAVCLLEDFELASGQSGKTTAHFTTALDNRYFEIEKYHGRKGSKAAAQSHKAALQKVKEIVDRENIDCELEELDGYLFVGSDARPRILQRELRAARRAGLADTELLEKSPLTTFEAGCCLRFPNQMQLHPLKYLRGLAKILSKRGVQIFTHTHVKHVEGGKPAIVTAKDGFEVKCKSVVVATNTPINDLFAIHTKQAPYRTYVVGFQIPKNSIPKALYWDTLAPYHYLRLESRHGLDHDILIVGGEDHKTGQGNPEACYKCLEDWTCTRFPMAQKVLYRWSGQVMEPVDAMGFLGHNPLDQNNIYVITGDSGNGMTHCTVGAMLITDQIMGRKNPWQDLYDPSRITLKAAPIYIKENANVAAQYIDWLALKHKPDFKEIPIGEGRIFRDGLHMIAAYKDKNGEIECMSAACPHLAGVVSWNSVEKSWDCPCHGSRFDCHGKVIEGPAFKDLTQVSLH